jgi:hypothetical protein
MNVLNVSAPWSPHEITSKRGGNPKGALDNVVNSGIRETADVFSSRSQNPPLDFGATGDSEGTSGGQSPMDSARSSSSPGPQSAEADPDLMSRDPTLLAVMQRLDELGNTAVSRDLLKKVNGFFDYHSGNYPAAKIRNGGGPYQWNL